MQREGCVARLLPRRADGLHERRARPRDSRGARMLCMTALRTRGIDAAVWYHGGDTEKYLGEVDGLDAPLLMHLAEEDEFISKPAQAEIKAALARKPHTKVHSS